MQPQNDGSSAEDPVLSQQEDGKKVAPYHIYTHPFRVNRKEARPRPYSKWGEKTDTKQQPRWRLMEVVVSKVLRQRTTLQELMTPKYLKGPLQKLVCYHYQEVSLGHDDELSAVTPYSLQPVHLDALILVLASTQMWKNEIYECKVWTFKLLKHFVNKYHLPLS